MGDWFTVEKIEDDTFAISEYSHWEEAHSYLLCGTEAAALIDTGLGVADVRAVVGRLTALPVRVLTTHVHWDHIGGHGLFGDVAVHAAEAGWLNGQFPIPLQAVRRNLMRLSCEFPEGFDPQRYEVFQGPPSRILRDGDIVSLGSRTLAVLHTPGHSPGHCCFYEAARGDLYSGDLIYQGCLDAFYPSTDPELFWRSVQRVQRLHPRRILPGHHRLSVPMDLLPRIEAAFARLSEQGRLAHGAGVLDCGDFQIHI